MPNSIYPAHIFATNSEDEDRLVSQPTNKYVNFYGNKNEHQLLASQVGELIQTHGVEMVYLSRTYQNEDVIFGEDPTSSFEKSYRFAIRIENTDNWVNDVDNTYTEAEGLIWDAEIKCVVEAALFKFQVPITGDTPLVGDLIYFPIAKVLFEITYTSLTKGHFFELGSNPSIELTLKKFTYSDEPITNLNIGEYQDGTFECSIDGYFDQLSCELAGGVWESSQPAVYVCSDSQYTDQATCLLNNETWDLVPQAIPGIDNLTDTIDKNDNDESSVVQTEGDTHTSDNDENNPYGISI